VPLVAKYSNKKAGTNVPAFFLLPKVTRIYFSEVLLTRIGFSEEIFTGLFASIVKQSTPKNQSFYY